MGFPSLPVIAVLSVYAMIKLRRDHLLLASLSGAVFIFLMLIYFKQCFGSYFSYYGYYLVEQKFVDMYKNGVINMPGIGKVLNLTFLTHRGYFIYMPVMIPSIAAIIVILTPSFPGKSAYIASLKKSGVSVIELLTLAAIFMLSLLLNAGLPQESEGYSWGPRYLLPTVPFMLLLSASTFRYIKRTATGILIAVSVIINAMGSSITPHTRDLFSFFAEIFAKVSNPQLLNILVVNSGLFPASYATEKIAFLASLALFFSIAAAVFFIKKYLCRNKKNMPDKCSQ